MNSLYKWAIVLGFFATACQEASRTPGPDEMVFDAQNSDCIADGTAMKIDELQINGEPTTVVGQKVQFQLDQKISCSQLQNVSWKSGSNLIGYGAKVLTSFKKAGVYMMTATIDNVPRSIAAQKSSEEEILSSAVLSLRTVVAGTDILIMGPQVGFENQTYEFSLALPKDIRLASTQWSSDSGTAVTASGSSFSVSFSKLGSYTVTARTVDTDSVERVIKQKISIVSAIDSVDCPVDHLDIIGATSAVAGQSEMHSVYIPACLTSQITGVKWNFADGSSPNLNQTVSHIYYSTGLKTITVELFKNKESKAWVTLSRQLNVVVATNPGPEPEPSPDPGSAPVDPNVCFNHQMQRSYIGEIYSVTTACGAGGTKTSTYRDVKVQECQLIGEFLNWIDISKDSQLIQEGECLAQACTGFGPHGTKKTNVNIGTISVPVNCKYEETGIASVYSQLADQTCNNGQVVNSNIHQGELVTAGLCPTYGWTGTDHYSVCSADCGGTQTRTFDCQDNKGQSAPAERCASASPVETRVCDGNPEAVRSVTSQTTTEEAGSSALCPKNQIGVIMNHREVTVTETKACIDHKVQLESSVTTATAWVAESFCRDFVAARCSNDSLSTAQALGRYQWMVKCQEQNPMIKDFLVKFDDVHYGKYGFDDGSRHLYATFMNTATKKVWVAPTLSTASCTIPNTVYIAAVCVSSCATPEQQILAQAQTEKKMKSMTFIEALTRKTAYVGTLQPNSEMNSRTLDKTAVDQWVTELEDTTQAILIFNLKSGGQLKLTLNHPLLSQQGSMKLASEFKVGENLVQLGGRLDPILSIETVQHTGKVYNVFVKSNDLKKNVVVIDGYLSGTAFYQNEGAKYMNRSLFRQQLTEGVFQP